jgi:hypothetical protein
MERRKLKPMELSGFWGSGFRRSFEAGKAMAWEGKREGKMKRKGVARGWKWRSGPWEKGEGGLIGTRGWSKCWR